MITRKEAMQELLAKIEAGVKYETMGHTVMCQKAFPKPDDFDGSPEAYAKSAAQMAGLVWLNGSLDAAKALHEAVLPGWRYNLGWTTGDERVFASVWPRSNMWGWIDANADTPARAWLIAIIKALIAQEPT